jgi:hypothetical protein
MVKVQSFVRSRRVQIAFNAVFGVVLLGVSVLSARHFMSNGWPLHHADPILVAGAAFLFLIAYAFKAWGWQRLFAEHERPDAGSLAFAGGAACVGGVALPGRLDDALRIACVKRVGGCKAGFGALGISLVVLGLLDNAALTPMASVAAVSSSKWTVQLGFAVVAAAGVAAAFVVAFLPKVVTWRRLSRFKMVSWLAEHTHCTREAWAAWILVSFSWCLRGTAVFLLLNALAFPSSFPLALAFMVGTAASAALPIAPAGAATQAGAGAAILIAAGVHAGDALAFSVAAQALVIVTGAAVMLLIGSWRLAIRVRRPRAVLAPAPAQV